MSSNFNGTDTANLLLYRKVAENQEFQEKEQLEKSPTRAPIIGTLVSEAILAIIASDKVQWSSGTIPLHNSKDFQETDPLFA